MSIQDCIERAAADGHMTPEEAREYFRRYADAFNDSSGNGLSWYERERRIAERLQAEIEREVTRKARMRLFQAQAQDRIRARIEAAPAGKKLAAAKAVLDFDPSLQFVGENVAARHASLRDTAFAEASAFVDRYRSKLAGLTRETEGIEDVVRGLFGERTTSGAKALADGIMRARDFLRGRHNAAGGDIVQRENWGWVQSHDRTLIARGGKDNWVQYVLDRIDPARMYGPDGTPLTDRGLREHVAAAYDNIITGGLEKLSGGFDPKFGSPISARVHHRELVFRDARAWLEYERRFGNGDIFGAIVGEIDRLARDTALIEVMGPYPRGTLERMKNMVDVDRAAIAETGAGKAAAKAAEAIGRHNALDALYDQVSGAANIPAEAGWARASQSNRNLITAARLGSALFASFSDLSTITQTARFNGLPITRVLGEMLRQLNPASKADRRAAARAGFIAETWIGHAVGAQRIMGEILGAPMTARIADTVLRASGLNAWTDAGRAAFKLSFVGHLTDNAHLAWNKLDDVTRRAMQRYGITSADWEYYRSTPIWTDPETGAEFIRPEDVWREFGEAMLEVGEKTERFRTAQKFNDLISTEAQFAVVAPTARSRALTTGGTQPGTFWGEAVRNLTLFRSFSVAFLHMHMHRAMAERGVWSKGRYLAWTAIGMTLGGALAEQASHLNRGKDPVPMDDPKFWTAAFLRGGVSGPIGDFLFSDVSRHGNTLAESILGPVIGGQVVAGTRATVGNLQELVKTGEVKNLSGELRQFADGLLPGRSLWYARLAFERLVGDELEAFFNPDAIQRFRRVEQKARQDFNTNYWWRPGEALPERAPEIGGKQ